MMSDDGTLEPKFTLVGDGMPAPLPLPASVTVAVELFPGSFEPKPAFVDYARRMTDRPAYVRAKEIDGKLIAEMEAQKAQAPQPA